MLSICCKLDGRLASSILTQIIAQGDDCNFIRQNEKPQNILAFYLYIAIDIL